LAAASISAWMSAASKPKYFSHDSLRKRVFAERALA
jgi:hypothetical protein